MGLRVDSGDGDPSVQAVQRSTSYWFSWDGDGESGSGTSSDPFPWELTPLRDGDGLVASRPARAESAQELMWQDYRFVAMLDPVELADAGADRRSAPATRVDTVAESLRQGRPTWWAEVAEGAGYDPRCTCCPLLDGELAHRLYDAEGGPRGPEASRPTSWATRWRVGLDRETGIVVSLVALDGPHPGTGFELSLQAVDEEMPRHLFQC